MIHNLHIRFIRTAMLSIALVLFLFLSVVMFCNIAYINQEINSILLVLSENHGDMPDYPFPETQSSAIPDSLQTMHFSPETPYSIRYFVLKYSEDGRLLSSDLSHIASVTEEDVAPYLAAALTHGEGTHLMKSYKCRITAEEDGTLLAIFLDCRETIHLEHCMALFSLLALLVCLGLTLLFLRFFSRRIVAPIERNMEQQKRFITDASHDLKTPITALTTSLKLLEMDVGPHHWLEKAQSQTERLTGLVNQLVTLSRVSEEVPLPKQERFPLCQTVRDVAEPLQSLALSSGRTFELNLPSEFTYCGDEYSIRQLVFILLDNAVKYSDAEGTIRLWLEKTRTGFRLKTYNTCPPMDPAEAEKLFDRFYRLDKARTRQGCCCGSGIGLSIAKSIVEAHHGSIEAVCPTPTSIVFTAQLKQLS